MKVLLIAGARPNFIKISPIYRESLKHETVDYRIVHTGQHYDYEMSEAFFEDLEIPEPQWTPTSWEETKGDLFLRHTKDVLT